jgi:hypothetical protein
VIEVDVKKYSKTEIQAAFENYTAVLSRSVKSGNWEEFASLFTDSVDYCDNGQRQWSTPSEILDGVVAFYNEYPTNHVADLIAGDSIVNVECSRVTFELYVEMQDPGDGSSSSIPITGVLHYAGDKQWCGQEDYYNLETYGAFLADWEERHRRLGSGMSE